MGNERLLLGIFGVFGVFGISFFVAGGFWDSVGRGPRRGFRKYLSLKCRFPKKKKNDMKRKEDMKARKMIGKNYTKKKHKQTNKK